MNNRRIAQLLFNVSTILAAHNGNPYRIRAYRRAAGNLLRMREQVADRLAAGQPLGVPRLGKSLTAKISALAQGDAAPFYDEICAVLPPEQRPLLYVPGLGPTIAARIHKDLGTTDPDSLRRAAATGKLQRIWGIGPKRTAAILDTLANAGVQQERLEL